MRAMVVATQDRTLTLTDLDRPEPGAGEIQLRIHACGLNFADLLMIKGTYQDTPPLPFTLGMEVAGEVTALGQEVSGLRVGDRVAVFGGQGGLAEYGCFPADRAVPLPEGMPYVDGAAFQIAYGTSHVALDHRARLQESETLCVLGAAGGVGLTAVELGKLMGARVIAVARGAAKLEAARAAGADHLLDATACDLRAELKALGGIDILYDPVGGDQWKDAFRAARPEARLLPIGFASGEVPQVPTNHLLVKNISVLGVYWGGYMAFRPKVITDSLRTLLGWYADGRLKPHVSHVLPLEQTSEGLELMRSRASTGKVVIEIG